MKTKLAQNNNNNKKTKNLKPQQTALFSELY